MVDRSLEGTSNPKSIPSETQCPASVGASLAAHSLRATQRSISSIEATWQAAQSQTASPALIPTPQDQSPDLEVKKRKLEHPELRTQEIQISGSKLSEQDLTSPKAYTQQNRISDSNLSEQDHHWEQSSERVLPSIEFIADPISSPTMADQFMSTAEKLKRARTAAAENIMAEQRAARTASAIPHTPPPPPPTTNQMLPLRETAPEAPAELADSAEQYPKVSSAASDLEPSNLNPEASPDLEEKPDRVVQLLPLGENVFAVPLPMVSLARDIYDQEITNHRVQRHAFLRNDKVDKETGDDIDAMLERLGLICDHQDLIDNSASQAMENDQRQVGQNF